MEFWVFVLEKYVGLATSVDYGWTTIYQNPQSLNSCHPLYLRVLEQRIEKIQGHPVSEVGSLLLGFNYLFFL